MPKIKGINPIEQAFFDAWIEYAESPDEEQEQRINTFEQQWGGLDIDAFKHALQEGNTSDRLVAIFAIGNLAYANTKELLIPFLSSSIRKERWASAIVLGEQKDEQVFALLGQLLMEKMEYFPPFTEEEIQNARNVIFQTIEHKRGASNIPITWEHHVHPSFVQIWHAVEAYNDEYTWYMRHRITITTILGNWDDLRTISMLRQALQRCWQIEQLSSSRGRFPNSFLDIWFQLEDELAYALGQLEAWNALDGLEFPSIRFKLARLYLVFGSLHINIFSLECWNIIMNLRTGTLNPNQVVGTLQRHFGLNIYLAESSLRMFEKWYQERKQIALLDNK